jgi:aminopeptidase
MRDARVDRLAHVLVNYCTEVKPDQLVRINGNAECQPLLASIAESVVSAGGHPMVRMVCDEAEEALLRLGSDRQLEYVNPISKFEMESIDVYIAIRASENTKAQSNIDPRRVSLHQAARRPILNLLFNRAAAGELRWVGTQYPTRASAQDAEMSLREYADFVFEAGLLHHDDPAAAWRRLGERQQRLVNHLNGKSEYRVVAANGTDVRMSIAGHVWMNCNGKQNFPDGEVFTGPAIDSVNGQINFSFPAVHLGREVTDVRLTFRDGKVIDARASKGNDFLTQMLDSDEGARRLGECAIGTNYGIRRYTKNTLFDEKIGGTVHFAVGAGYPETGNRNQSGLHWDMVVDLRSGGRIEVDGEAINIDGRFTRPEWPAEE